MDIPALSEHFEKTTHRLTFRPFQLQDNHCIQQTWQNKAPDCFSQPVFVAHDSERVVGFITGTYGHGEESYIFNISTHTFVSQYNKNLNGDLLKTAFLVWVSRKFSDITHYRAGFLGKVIPISNGIPAEPKDREETTFIPHAASPREPA